MPANDDYFAIAGVSGVVTATLTFDTNAVLEVALLDSSGATIASASGSTPQTVSTPGAVTGTVYVRVRAEGNAQGAYTLSVELSDGNQRASRRSEGYRPGGSPCPIRTAPFARARCARRRALARPRALAARRLGPEAAFAAATAAPGTAISPADRTLTFTGSGDVDLQPDTA